MQRCETERLKQLALNVATQIFNVPLHRAARWKAKTAAVSYSRSSIPRARFDPKAPELTNIMGDVKAGFDEDILAQYLVKLESDIGVN